MPLLDHFHPPLAGIRHWQSFHAVWSAEMVASLNRKGALPSEYFAEAQVHIGSRVEVDVATLHQEEAPAVGSNDGGGVAVQTWAPPLATLVMPAVFPDEIEVQVYGTVTGATLVAAVELVSPGNKDRPETRRAFAIKCASYLQVGIGLIVVDVVTERLANLHDELIDLLQQPATFRFPGEAALYTVAYRPVRRQKEGDQIDLWPVGLALGQALPVMPLALRDGPAVPLDLEATYTAARQRSRL